MLQRLIRCITSYHGIKKARLRIGELVNGLLGICPQDIGGTSTFTLAPQTQRPRRRPGVLLSALPLVANRQRIYGDIIFGILGIFGEAQAVAVVAGAGAMPGESYLIIIPTFVFALLLIESSMLTCQEG